MPKAEEYEDYLRRCKEEDLQPLSMAAWKLVTTPMTEKSMRAAWKTTLRLLQGKY